MFTHKKLPQFCQNSWWPVYLEFSQLMVNVLWKNVWTFGEICERVYPVFINFHFCNDFCVISEKLKNFSTFTRKERREGTTTPNKVGSTKGGWDNRTTQNNQKGRGRKTTPSKKKGPPLYFASLLWAGAVLSSLSSGWGCFRPHLLLVLLPFLLLRRRRGFCCFPLSLRVFWCSSSSFFGSKVKGFQLVFVLFLFLSDLFVCLSVFVLW